MARLVRPLACLVLGFLLGNLFYNFLAGRWFDELHAQRLELQAKLAAAETRLARLEESLAAASEPVVREVEVRVGSPLNAALKAQVKKEVEEWLSVLIGRPLTALDPETIPFLVHRRSLKLNGRSYLLTVETTVLTERLLMYVRVQQEDGRNSAQAPGGACVTAGCFTGAACGSLGGRMSCCPGKMRRGLASRLWRDTSR